MTPKLLIFLALFFLSQTVTATWMNPANVSSIPKDEIPQYVMKQIDFHNQTADEETIRDWTALIFYPCIFKTAPFELMKVCPNGCAPGHWDYAVIYIKWCGNPEPKSFGLGGGVGCCEAPGTEWDTNVDHPDDPVRPV